MALVDVPSITFMDQMETGSDDLDFKSLPPILHTFCITVVGLNSNM